MPWQVVRDHPEAFFLTAVNRAEEYGLLDLDRLEFEAFQSEIRWAGLIVNEYRQCSDAMLKALKLLGESASEAPLAPGVPSRLCPT